MQVRAAITKLSTILGMVGLAGKGKVKQQAPILKRRRNMHGPTGAAMPEQPVTSTLEAKIGRLVIGLAGNQQARLVVVATLGDSEHT